MVKEDLNFSEIQTAEGALHAKREFHFPIDKPTLKARANMALRKQHEHPHRSLPEILKEVLSDIHRSEWNAYASAIGKMFNIRKNHHKVSA